VRTLVGVTEAHMREFWDRRADEDALYFVDNRLEYGRADADRFWASGPLDLDTLLGSLGVTIAPSDSIVEIGCGVGRLTRPLSARAARVTALDISGRMLALARHHNPQLENVDWLHGDGSSLAGIDDACADGCVSHVVFQHIPDPAVTLSYVRDMGRVLRPGGWAAFQISDDPRVHRAVSRRSMLRTRVLASAGRGPHGQADPAWLGSAVSVDALRSAAGAAELDLERVVGAGTQFCLVLARRGP